MISAHFNNTIITDSFCKMNTNDQIQTKIPTVIRSTTVFLYKTVYQLTVINFLM